MPVVVPAVLVLPSVGVEMWRNVPEWREACIGGGELRLRLEDVAKEMNVRHLRITRTILHLGPEIGMGLVGRLDLGEAEEPVLPVMDGATRHAGQPDIPPILGGLTRPHLMLAGAERQHIALKVRGRAVLLEGCRLVIPLHSSDDVGVGSVV